jgi:pentatricopeptide repeat protein
MKSMHAASGGGNDADFKPDVMGYMTAIVGCSKAGEYVHALSLMTKMRREGIQPNDVMFSAAINSCATASTKLARRRKEEDANGGVHGNINVNGDDTIAGLENLRTPMNRALKLLAAMKLPGSSVKPNIMTYNTAIRACAEGLNLDGAFNLLLQLREDGLEPTIITYGSLMMACEQVVDVKAASKVYRMVKEEEGKSKTNSSVGGSGGADGRSEDQEHLQANEIIYRAAISCCCKAREPERALLLL